MPPFLGLLGVAVVNKLAAVVDICGKFGVVRCVVRANLHRQNELTQPTSKKLLFALTTTANLLVSLRIKHVCAKALCSKFGARFCRTYTHTPASPLAKTAAHAVCWVCFSDPKTPLLPITPTMRSLLKTDDVFCKLITTIAVENLTRKTWSEASLPWFQEMLLCIDQVRCK